VAGVGRRVLGVGPAADQGDDPVANLPAAHARAEFGDLPFAEVRDRVKARLVEERIASDVKAVVADLRGRATVRMLVDLSQGT
jgi:hypothetical protein